MNREDIIRMAREADLICESRPVTAWMESTDLTPYLTRFAGLVAAAERERIAKEWDECSDSDFDDIDIGATIRARGQA